MAFRQLKFSAFFSGYLRLLQQQYSSFGITKTALQTVRYTMHNDALGGFRRVAVPKQVT
jgi:hypothetical protein